MPSNDQTARLVRGDLRHERLLPIRLMTLPSRTILRMADGFYSKRPWKPVSMSFRRPADIGR